MNKQVIIVMAILAVIFTAGVYVAFFGSNKTTAPTEKTTNTPDKSSDTAKPDTATKTTNGSYEEYSETTFSQTTGTRLLFFHASWCPQCRALDKDIISSKLPDKVTIFKVDYDTNEELRQKYGVTIQTTIVKVDSKGNKVDSYVAYDEPTLASLESNLLP